ncbi:SRPBCC family protein [Aurantimicrobium minutum]|uniref:SRPBCC family protein n=1 Tax=Aurantimicrobium minutum TaxID=708131 RepID=UPI0024742732|nr:SRPBCC family protein [Aurantimicrobium minutum]MDH6422971.1 hypothetical protein [Aurantimicrobium minutum]
MPKPYSLQVSEDINAPIDVVFDVLNDLNQLDAWSPFVAMDPSIVSSISTPATGVGAVYAWKGKRIGSGSMTMTVSTKPNKIAFDMEFNGKDKALSEYLITETDGVTTVTWFLGGERGLGGQIMNALFKFDKMMAKNFADGLGKLKSVVEAKTAK